MHVCAHVCVCVCVFSHPNTWEEKYTHFKNLTMRISSSLAIITICLYEAALADSVPVSRSQSLLSLHHPIFLQEALNIS